MTKHKYAELIKAWADNSDLRIQCRPRGSDGEYIDTKHPGWCINFDYRIKPEPKPNIVEIRKIIRVLMDGCVDIVHYGGNVVLSSDKNPVKVEYTFDGETGVLKGVKLLHSVEMV